MTGYSRLARTLCATTLTSMPTDTLSLLLELFPINVALDHCGDGVPFVFACQDGALKRFDAGSIAMWQCSSTEKPWEFHHGSARVERLAAGKFCFDHPEKTSCSRICQRRRWSTARPQSCAGWQCC